MFIVLIWLTCMRNNPVEWNNWYWTEWTVCAQYPERLHHDQTTFLQSDAQLFLFFLKTFYLKYATILLDWFFSSYGRYLISSFANNTKMYFLFSFFFQTISWRIYEIFSWKIKKFYRYTIHNSTILSLM